MMDDRKRDCDRRSHALFFESDVYGASFCLRHFFVLEDIYVR